MLGLFFGIVAQELVFYTALFLSGLPPSVVVPWQHVIGANLLAGLALMAYLHRAEHAQIPLGLGALKAHPQLTRGLITGLIGAAAVAVFFFFIDLITSHPFATPAALGSAILFGASNADARNANASNRVGVLTSPAITNQHAAASVSPTIITRRRS